MTIPPLLDELLRAPGPSGSEDAVAAIVRREVAGLGLEHETDVLGTTVVRLRGAGGGPTLALVAHADQVGVVVQRLDESGRACVAPLGTWSAHAAIGQRFRVLTAAGAVPAVAVRVGQDAAATWDDVRLDVGAVDRAAAATLVAAGDPAVPAGDPQLLASGRIASAAIDDRAGVYAAVEALRRLAADSPACDVALVVSVQEETGTAYGGAVSAVRRLAPDIAVVVECTYASDAPSGPAPWGDLPLGGGPSVFRGPVVHPRVAQGLLDAAGAAGRAVGVESGAATWSDADGVFGAVDGVATGLLSVPVRHMHTAGEIAQLSDIEAVVDVLVAYARSLAPGLDLAR